MIVIAKVFDAKAAKSAIGNDIKISVGDGKQTFKWLAQVIQQRMKQFNYLRNQLKDEGVVILNIKNENNELINPIDFIYEHCTSDKVIIHIEISSSLPSDKWSYPIINDWFLSSYIKSEYYQKWVKEMELWRETLSQSNIRNNLTGSGSNINVKSFNSSANVIQIGENFTESDALVAFQLDWKLMKWSFLIPEHLESTPSPLTILSKILKSNYSLICDIFNHYCGVGKVGDRYGMSLIEFSHFIHVVKLLNINSGKHDGIDNNEVISFIFDSIAGSSDNKIPLLSRSDFAEAFIALCIFMNENNIVESSITSIISNHLVVYRNHLLKNYIIYSSNDALVEQTSREYYHLIKHVFNSYATHNSKLGLYITIDDCIQMMLSAALIDNKQKDLCINNILKVQVITSKDWELKEIVYTEFLEIVRKLAIETVMLPDIPLTEGKKIRIAYDSILDLDKISKK